MNRTNCVMIYLSTTHGCMNKHGIFIIELGASKKHGDMKVSKLGGWSYAKYEYHNHVFRPKNAHELWRSRLHFLNFLGCPTNRTMVAFIGDRLSSWLIICKLPYHHCWLVSTCILHRGLVTNYKSKCNNYFWLLQLWGEHTRRYPNARRLAHVYCNKNVSAAAG